MPSNICNARVVFHIAGAAASITILCLTKPPPVILSRPGKPVAIGLYFCVCTVLKKASTIAAPVKACLSWPCIWFIASFIAALKASLSAVNASLGSLCPPLISAVIRQY